MKKLLSVMFLVMSAIVVYAQETPSTETKKTPAEAAAPAASSAALKLSDLPKSVTESIAKDYPGYTIKEAMKAKEGSGADFKVVVAKGTTTETLLYDKNGKLVKKADASTQDKEMK